MKGIIFNLAEEVLTQAHGEELWDALIAGAGVDGSYTSLGNYPDSELTALVDAASAELGITPAAALRAIGMGALPLLAERYPGFFEPHKSAMPFVLTLNHIIHAEVRKLYEGADVPEFDFDEESRSTLLLGYRSARRLCALAEGFILGAACHYGEEVVIDQPECMHLGAPACVIRCHFRQLSSATGAGG